MNPTEVTVIIVNYNGGDYLQAAVDSLARQSFRAFELIVIDNSSSDGSIDSLKHTGIPVVRLVRNPKNLGFAAANNQAAGMASGRWLALLNPDAVAAPDWLELLLKAASNHPECMTFTSAQFDLANPSLMDGAGDAYLIFGIPWRGGFGHPASEMPASGWCFSACGAAAMYDKERFLRHGGFDERFFCYCEDVDLGFRMQLEGLDCLFVREAVVHHAGSGISGRASAFATYHGTRNLVWTYVKNMPLALLLVTLPGHFLLTLYLVFSSAFTPRFKPIVRGLVDGLKGLPAIRRSAEWRVEKPTIRLTQLVRRMAWNPWRMSARKTYVR